MREVTFKDKSFDEFNEWLSNDRKIAQRIVRLLKECQRTPFEGIGKPEPLKGGKSGLWSRRINDEHRLVYEVTNASINVLSLHGHYDD